MKNGGKECEGVEWDKKKDKERGMGIEGGRQLGETQLHESIGTMEYTFLSCISIRW